MLNAEDLQKEIDRLAGIISEARVALMSLLIRAFPEPQRHEFRQHRDRRPPWCPCCRRTATGMVVPRRVK